MSRFNIGGSVLHLILAALVGLGLGLVYSWVISPVTYVDASPAILRADFKDQYRIVIAKSYTSTHDLARARSRLELLGDPDPAGELSALAQRLLADGETFESTRPLAQLATDLKQGFASVPSVQTPFTSLPQIPEIDFTEPPVEETEEPVAETSAPTQPFFEQTPLAPVTPAETSTPRPTFTPLPGPGAPFSLVGQDTVCDPSLEPGLMQFQLMDSRRNPIPGIEIIVTWNQGEDRSFTGFKPELGKGYADFIMQADTVYNIRIVNGGAFVQNLSAPTCTDPNGLDYLGGLMLVFQQS